MGQGGVSSLGASATASSLERTALAGSRFLEDRDADDGAGVMEATFNAAHDDAAASSGTACCGSASCLGTGLLSDTRSILFHER